jgi:hypothetical protein
MSKTGILVAVGCCCASLAMVSTTAQAQSRKAGLWEVTTQMSMSGGPTSMPQMPPRTNQVCVTQAMIDKYGGPTSQPARGNCQMTDVSLTATGMTANMVCTGQMTMTGTVQATFVDANTTKTTVQMTMPMGQNTMNMTMQSTASFKGTDCGSVQPMAMPATK